MRNYQTPLSHGVPPAMNDLEPWLAACEHALVAAELYLARLTGLPSDLVPELSAVRLMIAAMRIEVEQLHGGPIILPRRKKGPLWTDIAAWQTPWTPDQPKIPRDPG
jgi:hypothetical protein